MALALPLNRIAHHYERYSRWLPPAVSAVLVVAIAWTLAKLVWALVPVPAAAQWRPAPVAPLAAAMARTGGPNVQAIVDAQLFGAYAPPAVAQAVDLNNAPDTRLNLTLLGILAGTDETKSRALISTQEGDEQPYAIGDDVGPNVTLQAIFPDRVILLRAGQPETLRLNKDQPSNSPAYAQAEVAAPEQPSTNTSVMVSQIREQVLADPSKASDYIRVQPANVGGQIHGYRIYPGRERALFTEVGLRPGDLVTAVNGIQLNDTQTALQMLNDLSRAPNVTLTIERGGQVQTVNVSLN
ncbi:MAG TPA: type II secretion system protein GspC [Solimonas sp.]|nr:type II secretion system protein GspC [Solimonas sp.]